MAYRHITVHDESGVHLRGITRELSDRNTQIALSEFASKLAACGYGVCYAQKRLLGGMVLSKAYPCGGRILVDSLYFPDAAELAEVYLLAPLGDSLFFADAPLLEEARAVAAPDIASLEPSAVREEFSSALGSIFTSTDSLADLLCALRTGTRDIAFLSDLPAGEFSSSLHMALELILRAFPPSEAAKIEYVTQYSDELGFAGLVGCTEDISPDPNAYFLVLPGNGRSMPMAADALDRERAEALKSGNLERIVRLRGAEPRQIRVTAQPVRVGAAPGVLPDSEELVKVYKTLAYSIWYANSSDFRAFTTRFMKLKRKMSPANYFQYALTYSDFLHRLSHPMYEVYDNELASLYREQPEGLPRPQTAAKLTGFPGALRGVIEKLKRDDLLPSFIGDALPALLPEEVPSDYAARLIKACRTMRECLGSENDDLLVRKAAAALTAGLMARYRTTDANAFLATEAALRVLLDSDLGFTPERFDGLMSVLIDRLRFDSLDVTNTDTYAALEFAYSYVKEWAKPEGDRKICVLLWGRLISGYGNWNERIMDSIIRMLASMASANRVEFMNFERRYFITVCSAGMTRAQMSESVLVIVLLTALVFNKAGEWHLRDLDNVLDRLSTAGDGLEAEFARQIRLRPDMLSAEMYDSVCEILAQRGKMHPEQQDGPQMRPAMVRPAARRETAPEKQSAKRHAEETDAAEAPRKPSHKPKNAQNDWKESGSDPKNATVLIAVLGVLLLAVVLFMLLK